MCESSTINSRNTLNSTDMNNRKPGRPPKPNAVRDILHNHSLKYWRPIPGRADGKSQAEIDIEEIADPYQRLCVEIKILPFHTAQIKAVDMTIGTGEQGESIADLLKRLSSENGAQKIGE